MATGALPAAANYGPITGTTFTPASSCDRIALQTSVPFKATTIYGGHADCYPNSALWNFHYGFQNVGKHYFSPALYCPVGYTTAATWGTEIFGLETAEAPVPGETAIYCCPSSYKIADYGNCYSNLTVGQPMTQETLINRASWSEGSITTADVSTNGAVAWSIQLRYQSSDLTSSTSSSSRTTSTTSPTASASTTSVSSSGGLSTGAKAAIGTVIPIVVLSLLVGIFWFFRKRKKQAIGDPPDAGEMAGSEKKSHVEAPDNQVAEMSSSTRPVELDGGVPTYEVPAEDVKK